MDVTGTDLPSDGIYAYALSKTLVRVAPPATVGLYSSCHSLIHQVLKDVEAYMNKEAMRREEINKGQNLPRTFKGSILNLSILLFKLLFFDPVYTEKNQNPKNVRYIFVRFSAWHFAGSDILWAGLVMRLYMAFQEHFGRFLLSLYRVTQYTETTVRRVIEDKNQNWKPKKICCIPVWLFTILTFVGMLLMAALLIKSILQKGIDNTDHEEDAGDWLNVIEGFAIATLGVPVITVLRFLFLFGKNLIFNQDHNLRSMMDNEKVSDKLGLMNEIRKEMEILSSFIHFMEVFERREIRVVLEITHLDRCSPWKIVGVLDAINILLSDEDSPFISLLAVNPEVLAQQVDYARDCISKEDKAHAFLNRIVTLAFTVPELCDASKRKVFQKISHGHLEFLRDSTKTSFSLEESSVETGSNMESFIPLVRTTPIEMDDTFVLNEDKAQLFTESAFEYVYSKGNLHTYIMGDTMSMRRIVNSIRVSVILMEALKTEMPSPEHIAAWVVLANQWPCRLSWILQCVDDDRQRANIDQASDSSVTFDTSKTLWKVFSESRMELHMIREKVHSLLEQDGDPELFEMFLKNDFKFTIEDSKKFKPSTVNLDHSIQRELAMVRGSSRIKDTVSRKTAVPLHIKSVLNMNTEDVCSEMKKLGLLNRYAEAVRENALDGQALVYSDNNDIREVLQMSLGDWTVFAIHFLGLTPPVPSCLTSYLNKPASAVTKPSPFPSVANLLSVKT